MKVIWEPKDIYPGRTEGLHPLVNAKRYGDYELVKYKKKVFYDNLWDKELLECRGRVYRDNKIAVNPFTKIFNYGENNTTCPANATVLAVQKINGFMGAYTNGLYTTTGSFESPYVDMFKELLPDPKLQKDVTWLFEIVHKSDPHIIREEPGVYLIGARGLLSEEYDSWVEKEIWLDRVAKEYNFKRPEWFTATFADVLDLAREAKHEGYVVYGSEISSNLGSHAALKIKSPFYLKAKALARGNRALDDDFAALKEMLPENLTEQERLDFIFKVLENRKTNFCKEIVI